MLICLSVYLSVNIYMYSMHGCDNHKTLISFCFRNISRVMLRVRVCWRWSGPISMAVVEMKTQTHRNRTAFLCCSMPVKMMCLMLEVRMSHAPWWFLPPLIIGQFRQGCYSIDFCPALLKPLGCFYFRCVFSSQWKAVTVNLQVLHCQL